MTFEIEEGRKPVQARSKQRVRLIMDTAIEIILEKNVEKLTMNDLAHKANLPVGSIYQYFPSKRALLKSLLEERLSLISDEIFDIIKGIKNKSELVIGLRKNINTVYEKIYKNGFGYKIWIGTQYDPALRKIHDDDVKVYTDLLCNKISEIQEIEITEELYTRCKIYNISVDACMRSVIDTSIENQQRVIHECGNIIFRDLKLIP